jgi:hypothetical protein
MKIVALLSAMTVSLLCLASSEVSSHISQVDEAIHIRTGKPSP